MKTNVDRLPLRTLWILFAVFVLSFAGIKSVNAQGGLTLFGDVKINSGEPDETSKAVTIILYKDTGGEIGRQTISSKGRYRFTNLRAGDYDIVIEVDGKEVGRVSPVTVGGLSNSPYGYQYDLDFKLKPAGGTTPAGVISAADAYDRPATTSGIFHKAEEAVSKKKYDQAVELLKQVLEIDQQDFQAWNALGTVYTVQEKNEDAENAYSKAVEVRPAFARAQLNLGRVRSNLKKFPEAIEPLTHAVEAQPDSAEANMLLGEAYLQIRKGSKAIPYLNEAARLGRPEAHLRLGWLYNAAGMKDKAAIEYEEFLKKQPNYPDKNKLKDYISANKKE